MSKEATGADDLSFEAMQCFVPIKNKSGLTPAREQVYALLVWNKRFIADAEKRYQVSRVAIAGAIAWELLANPRRMSVRAVGLGKVHLNSGYIGGYFGREDNTTAAAEAESRGYIGSRSYEERKLALQTPREAIDYIAAIMRGIADATARAGFGNIYDDPIILTNVYQSMTLSEWDEHLSKKAKGSKLAGGNDMDIWVKDNINFLISAVGPSECMIPQPPKADEIFRSSMPPNNFSKSTPKPQ